MTIAVVVPNPSFGAAYNIARALDGVLICDRRDGWREWEPDILLDSDSAINQARKVIDISRHVLIISTWGLETWRRIGAEHAQMAFLAVESRIERDPRTCLSEIRAWDFGAMYHLPNLAPYMPDRSVAMLQPVDVPASPAKAADGPLLVLHTPGTEKKRVQKGSVQIAAIIADIDQGAPIEYRELLMVSHAEALRARARAHVCVDQLPPPGFPRGLGLSGEESLAYGCATISTMYPRTWSPLYPYPPVLAIENGYGLHKRLVSLATRDRAEVIEMGDKAHKWAKQHISLSAWRDFYMAHLPEGWA